MNAHRTAPQEITEQEVSDHLVQVLADLLELAPDAIDPDLPLSAFGIDSATSTWLAGELERWCGFPLDRKLLLGRPSIVEAAEDVVAFLRAQPDAEARSL
ncbi:acyl carrier protein [Streptomyces piniterrae]|uniref:Acyl carrier protein n=1 Tax=Streptomyces piniterrae TaxID=2571125 RepID=A0A4U0NJC3_9ACTN|nr:acyl carrier protein [Streptomyces piniterrae]TJZ54290.1 acyl carrier protein [Streptomyces piniterrae]